MLEHLPNPIDLTNTELVHAIKSYEVDITDTQIDGDEPLTSVVAHYNNLLAEYAFRNAPRRVA